MKTIISPSKLDAKFEKILDDNINYVSGTFVQCIKKLFLADYKTTRFFYRYVSDQNSIILILKLIIYATLCHLRGIKFIYVMHNVKHYNNKTNIHDNTINKLLHTLCTGIIIFDEMQKKFIPKKFHNKIIGYLSYLPHPFINGENHGSVQHDLASWCEIRNDFVFMMSTVPLTFNNINNLKEINNLILINPNKNLKSFTSNTSFICHEFLYSDFEFLKNKKVIGLSLLKNMSVPTGFWHFIQTDWPMLFPEGQPKSDVICKAEIGQIYRNLSDVNKLSKNIFLKYDQYSKNVSIFKKEAISTVTTENGKILSRIFDNQ